MQAQADPHNRHSVESSPPSPAISVVICTRNRASDLARCLPTILASAHPTLEVVVVDQSTTDASKRVVNDAVKRANAGWRMLVVPEGAPARARSRPASLDGAAPRHLV